MKEKDEVFVSPFQLYQKAKLDQVIRSYQDNLEWNVIELVTKEKFTLQSFLRAGQSGAFRYTVEKVIPPEKHGRVFLAYAEDVARDFEKRIAELLQNKALIKDQKLRILSLCQRLALDSEERYDQENLFSFALGFHFKIKGEDGNFHGIPHSVLDFQLVWQTINDELRIRYKFFQWMRRKLDAATAHLQTLEFHDPLIIWKGKSPKVKIVEIVLALRRSGEFQFVDLEAEKKFEAYIERLFSITNVNWRVLEADIRKRKGKKGQTKWQLLEKLIEIPI